MKSPSPIQQHFLPECRAYLGAAERLIRTSSECVGSFFVSTKKENGQFVGFLRDSLVDRQALSPSTGGLSVPAYIYEVEPELCYIERNTNTPMFGLRKCRDESRNFFLREAKKIPIRKAFGTFNPLTFSVAAYLSSARLRPSDWNTRTAFFNAINLAHFVGKGWPRLDNVDKAHPYVAHNVLRAAAEISSSECLSALIEFLKNPMLPKESKVEISGLPPNEVAHHFAHRIAQIAGARDQKSLNVLLQDSSTRFQEEALQYLWEQSSYAPDSDGIMLDPLQYDPVGACFALNVLDQCLVASYKHLAVRHLLGEHGSLVLRSVQHILRAIGGTGALPYGVPFSYDPKGTGAFATSVSGLAALTRFLSRLLKGARKLGYPSSDVLIGLFTENDVGFQKLFSLAAIFESSPRECVINSASVPSVGHDMRLRGWWTDRAPSHKRVESWVTIEVFLFAVYLREIIQESAQHSVLRKYGALWPTSEPTWPYNPKSDGLREDTDRASDDDMLSDPDEAAADNMTGGTDEFGDLSPIRFLHRSFRKFMEPTESNESAAGWIQEISSILLFGPPGTAKTTTARSLAQALGWHFLELTPSNFIIDGMQLIEQRAKDIFDDLSLLRETLILFDELDSIFADRERLEQGSIVNFLVPAMLPKLQGLARRGKRQRLLVAIATNFYDRLDPAMVRLGRIDKHLLVLPYNRSARLRLMENFCELDLATFENEIAENTALYVFEELKELARIAKSGEWFLRWPNVSRKYPPAAIGPTLYMPRIPETTEKRLSQIRSTQRLAIEVCGIIFRLMDESRPIPLNEDVPNLIKLLNELEGLLSPRAKELGWDAVCQRLREALSPLDTVKTH